MTHIFIISVIIYFCAQKIFEASTPEKPLILIGICICFLLFYMVQIYAKYLTSAEGSTTLTIANWNILVNDLSIKNNTDI